MYPIYLLIDYNLSHFTTDNKILEPYYNKLIGFITSH